MSDKLKENHSGAMNGLDGENEIEETSVKRGREAITRAESCMIGLMECRRRHGLLQPLYGARIAGCSYLDAKTAVLIETMIVLGAEVQWTNPGYTYNKEEEDAVVAALKEVGISVHRWDRKSDSGVSSAKSTLQFPSGMKVNLIIDDNGLLVCNRKDGFDMSKIIPTSKLVAVKCKSYPHIPSYQALQIATRCDYDRCENSIAQYIKEITDKMASSDKACVVFGYSARGKSCARALRSAGVKVLISERCPYDSFHAKNDSFELVTLQQACKRAKVFVLATDCVDPILEYVSKMKDNSMICDIGSSDKDIATLMKTAVKVESTDVYLTRYKMDSGIHVEFLNPQCLDRVLERYNHSVSYSYTLWLLVAISDFTSHGNSNGLLFEAARLHL